MNEQQKKKYRDVIDYLATYFFKMSETINATPLTPDDKEVGEEYAYLDLYLKRLEMDLKERASEIMYFLNASEKKKKKMAKRLEEKLGVPLFSISQSCKIYLK